MLNPLSEEVEVTRKAQLAMKNLFSSGNWAPFWCHQSHGFECISIQPPNSRYTGFCLYLFKHRDTDIPSRGNRGYIHGNQQSLRQVNLRSETLHLIEICIKPYSYKWYHFEFDWHKPEMINKWHTLSGTWRNIVQCTVYSD